MPGNSWPNRADRLVSIDVIRYLSFLAILLYHLSYALWAPDELTHIPVRIPESEIFARALDFSGFTIVFLSFFLFGYKPKGSTKGHRLGILLLGFFAVWSVLVSEYPFFWDIYPFLLVALILLTVVKKLQLNPWPLFVASFVVTSIPFWRLEGVFDLPAWLEPVLWGVCANTQENGDWPLFPWAAYPLFAFSLGTLCQRYADSLKTWLQRERLFWCVVLGASVPWLGSYYAVSLGDAFGCGIFRYPATVFWAHQIWVFFFVRLSLHAGWAVWMQARPALTWFSRRSVNQQFYLVYFLHYPLIFGLAAVVRHFDLTYWNWTYRIAAITAILILEYAPVVIFRFFPQNRIYGGKNDQQR